jgi:NAD(P)-dependent dehydrogenase (short-subunit alcohol dehydrogenase family)
MEFYYWILIAIAILTVLIVLIRCIANGPKTPLNPDMTGKIVIVTGSNTGIGKITALELLRRGAKVIFASRDEAKTQEVIDSIQDTAIRKNASFIKLDLGSFESIKNFVQEFKSRHESLDILINNAGATFDKFILKENIEATFMTNHVGPVCLTGMLLDIINPKGKVINVSSRGHKHVTDNSLAYLYQEYDFSNIRANYKHLILYCLSKIGNVYHAQSLNEYFKRNQKQISTASLHPGLVNTDIFSTKRFSRSFIKFLFALIYPFLWLFAKDVEMGAQTTLHIAYLDYDELNSGAYFNNCKEEKLGEMPSDKEKRDELMNFTFQLIKTHWKDYPNEIKNYLEN